MPSRRWKSSWPSSPSRGAGPPGRWSAEPPMRSLLEAQRAMQRAILADDSDAPPIAQEAPPRIGIYRYAYRARLANALRANYPALARMMGDEAFRTLAAGYARAH